MQICGVRPIIRQTFVFFRSEYARNHYSGAPKNYGFLQKYYLYPHEINPMLMKTECASTVFHVRDLDAALAYYTNILGFSLDFRYGPLIGVQHGSVSIHLCGHDPGVNKQPDGGGHI